MLITLTVRLATGIHAHLDWACELEIDDRAPLRILHRAIAQTLSAQADSGPNFFIARSGQEAGSSPATDPETAIAGLFPLPRGKKLFCRLNNSDDWILQVARARKKPLPARPDRTYPRVSGETGIRPPAATTEGQS